MAASAGSQSSIHGVLELLSLNTSREVKDGSSRTRAWQICHNASVYRRQACRGVQRSLHASISLATNDEQLYRAFRKVVEMMEMGGSTMAYDRSRAGIVQRDSELEAPRTRCTGERKTVTPDSLKSFAIDPPLDVEAGDAKTFSLPTPDNAVLTFREFCERAKKWMHPPKECEPTDPSEPSSKSLYVSRWLIQKPTRSRMI